MIDFKINLININKIQKLSIKLDLQWQIKIETNLFSNIFSFNNN